MISTKKQFHLLGENQRQPSKTFNTIEISARLHYRAVVIHPFLNGNGRWSRMLANIYLKQNELKPTKWN
jgi:Fic family protein